MSTYFISDLHLDEQRPDITRAFLVFLQTTAASAKAVYILGDLFEAWIGDDYQPDWIKTIQTAIKTLTDTGVAVFFIHGNRDFLIRDHFAKRTGITLLPELCIMTLGDQKALIMHGDTLCIDDHEYQAARKLLRNPDWQNDFLAKSIPERLAIARQMRAESQSHMQSSQLSDTYETIMDVTPSEVLRVMQQHSVNLLIHGHTHRPFEHELTIDHHAARCTMAARRIVLGDWYEQNSILQFSDGLFELSTTPHQPVNLSRCSRRFALFTQSRNH